MPENQPAPSIRSFRSDRGPRTSSSATRDRTSFASAYHFGSGSGPSTSTSAYPSFMPSPNESVTQDLSPRMTTLSRGIFTRPKSSSGASLRASDSNSGHGTFETADQGFSNLGASTSSPGSESPRASVIAPRPDAYLSSSTNARLTLKRAPASYHGHSNVDRFDHDDAPSSSAASCAERSYERETTFLKYKETNRPIPTFERTYACVQRESSTPVSVPDLDPSSHLRRPAIQPHQKHPSIDSGYGGSHDSYCSSTSPNEVPATILIKHDSWSPPLARHSPQLQAKEKELPSECDAGFSVCRLQLLIHHRSCFAVPVDYDEQPLPPLPRGPNFVADSGLWNRLTTNFKSTVMHATTVSKDSLKPSNYGSDPIEENSTPDAQGESRLSRVIRDYHLNRAETIEDVPERQGCRRYSVQPPQVGEKQFVPQRSEQLVLQVPPKDLPRPAPYSRSTSDRSDRSEEYGSTLSNGRYRGSGGGGGTPSSRSIEKLLKMRAEERLNARAVVV
ncbi:BZ3500_MvSof-1268-A1-R1_Chr2-1g04270 [Microbotryum saponariae]|uniref:BZ3500_MvSof-1268-A1-R1_Chr2-1g04270 protein n=1 Tax=Microbotryum saponariae TaxID=289078 RepID=A0A2X0MAV1_9BASI|nr:BZ3500_MvSof-1268-A1-R1_Chr2-1g04270 [Microbotryum saponariae]SCZ91277.1 BZ3501_MvSof-1269-A2-R1_Chr2-1g03926 [Microbotryum saponariae]